MGQDLGDLLGGHHGGLVAVLHGKLLGTHPNGGSGLCIVGRQKTKRTKGEEWDEDFLVSLSISEELQSCRNLAISGVSYESSPVAESQRNDRIGKIE